MGKPPYTSHIFTAQDDSNEKVSLIYIGYKEVKEA